MATCTAANASAGDGSVRMTTVVETPDLLRDERSVETHEDRQRDAQRPSHAARSGAAPVEHQKKPGATPGGARLRRKTQSSSCSTLNERHHRSHVRTRRRYADAANQ
jgi:hypothetical protein